jgi:alginate O-acetyltransferase complex protein AlgJ
MPAKSTCILIALGAANLIAACHTGAAQFPWGDARSAPSTRADVTTLNDGYQRTRSKVFVRQIEKPTRAALDYAAYHANFMIADLEPEQPLPVGAKPDTTHAFAKALDPASLTSDIAKTPLTEEERRQPLAFAPLSERLLSRKIDGAEALAAAGAAVRDEKWGLALPPGVTGQQLSELYVHHTSGTAAELWAKVEFQPWFSPFQGSADQDGDGFPEVYGKLAANAATPALVADIEQDYAGKLLDAAEVKAWANQLSSYWYPSFNTDLVPAAESWPDAQTEADIKQELGGRTFEKPAIVLRGKPQGKPTYNVFLLRQAGEAGTPAAKPALKLAKTRPSPDPKAVAEALQTELARQGKGDYGKWQAELSPFHDALRKRVKGMPPKIKALAGNDGFLFYRNGLEYVSGGDLEKQRKGKNPLPIILEFKKELDQLGVDFLFVPVPDKLEIYPEKLDADFKRLDGSIVNPAFRKLLASLCREGVEVVDLLPPLLAAKAASPANAELLFQHQDTHWTDRGLRLTADLLSARIKKYPWYAELSRHAQAFSQRETKFTRFGDLQSRLPDAEQSKYTPETLVAHQVLRADKQPYDDDPQSPIVLLGDSFTGVYELTDAEHAGVSAHIARGVSYPLDLVMSYGGGPNVRQKLLRRGREALGEKKLVIWMMTARDLYNYWEDWEPLAKP